MRSYVGCLFIGGGDSDSPGFIAIQHDHSCADANAATSQGYQHAHPDAKVCRSM
jgi:hypothetical protein